MIFFLALLPATMLTIAGYVVLFVAARSDGALKSFGRYLGFWAFTLAGLVILGSIFAAAHGHRHCPLFAMHGMHDRAFCPWPPGEPRMPPPPGDAAHAAPPPAPNPPPADSAPPR